MNRIILIVVIALFTFSQVGNSQERIGKELNTLFEYLYSMEETPIIKIDTDTKKLVRDKRKEEYQPSVVSIKMADGEIVDWPSKIRARGNIRKEVCYFPPLKLNFKEKQLKENNFDSLDILKMVIQCRIGDNTAKYTRKERLAYHLYEQIDSLHFKTKNVFVHLYKDGELKEELVGFLIESEDHYAARMNCQIIEKGTLRSGILAREHFLKMGFFQYMIANPDYAIPNKHNVELLQLPSKKFVAVPYDFDYSGIVNTDYATPHESLGIKNVTDRIFLHKNVSFEEAKVTAQYYLSKEQEFYDLIANADYLLDNDRKTTTKFIEAFFRTLKADGRIRRAFVR